MGVIPAGSWRVARGSRKARRSLLTVCQPRVVRHLDGLHLPETMMNQRAFRLLECLDEQLRQMLCEIRFADSLIGMERQSLQIDSEDALVVTGRIVRQLQAARRITQRLHNCRR